MGEEEEIIGTLKPGEYEEGTQDNQSQPTDRRIIRKTLSELIVMTATEYGIEPQELYGKSRNRNASAARKALILTAIEHTSITRREIAKELRVTDTAITKLVTRGLEDQRERKERIVIMSHCQA